MPKIQEFRSDKLTSPSDNDVEKSKLHIEQKAILTGHRNPIYTLAPNPDGNSILSGAGDGWVASWDLEYLQDGNLAFQIEGAVLSTLYDHDSGLFVIGSLQGGMHFNNWKDKTNLENFIHHEKGVFALNMYGSKLLSAGAEGKLTKWDIEQR